MLILILISVENSPIARATCERRDGMILWVWEILCGGNKTKQEILEIVINVSLFNPYILNRDCGRCCPLSLNV